MSDLYFGAYLVVLLCATSLLSCSCAIFWFCLLCRKTGNDYNSQQDLNHQCEEGCGKSYSMDRNVIKISCPAVVLKEVNELFH